MKGIAFLTDGGRRSIADGLEVVMIGAKSFPPILGGIETHIYEISTRLARRGARVSVMVPRTASFSSVTEIQDVEVRPVKNIGSRYTLKLSMMPSLALEIRKVPGTLVHAHDATGGFVAAQTMRGGRLVYTMHGVGFHRGDWAPPFRQGIRLMQKIALKKAHHVFCTDALSAEYASSLRDQVEILPNAVDVRDFSTKTSRPPQYDEGKFVFLFVGRLAKVKGVKVLLDSISRIPEQNKKDAIFAFVGDGPLREQVLTSGKSIPQIRLIGTIPHADIIPYFTNADAFVLPSLSEGLPISLLEALAASLPCVASDVGGVSSQIPQNALRLVPPGLPDVLAKVMVDLMADRGASQSLGRAGRALVAERFSWDRVVDRLVEVYMTP